MKKLFICLSLMALIIACGTNGEKDSSASTVVVDGKTIYKNYCVNCHGLQGDMGAGGAANLKTSVLSLEERVIVITKGRNAMQAYENVLKPAQIEAVANFTLTLKESE